MVQRDLPSFWESELTCRIKWAVANEWAEGQGDESILFNDNNKEGERKSIDNKAEAKAGRQDILFLRVKKSSNLQVH